MEPAIFTGVSRACSHQCSHQLLNNAIHRKLGRRTMRLQGNAGFGLEDRQKCIGRDELLQFRFFVLGQNAILHFVGKLGVVCLLLGGKIERKNISGMCFGKATACRLDDAFKDGCTRCHFCIIRGIQHTPKTIRRVPAHAKCRASLKDSDFVDV
jgi:hypothetical protein